MHAGGGLPLEDDEVARHVADAAQLERKEAREAGGGLPFHVELREHRRALVNADLLPERHLRDEEPPAVTRRERERERGESNTEGCG